MDCTNFEFHSFHDRQPDIDHRREIIRSIAATAVFLAALSIAAIILAIQIGPANACATTESMPAAASSVPSTSQAETTVTCPL